VAAPVVVLTLVRKGNRTWAIKTEGKERIGDPEFTFDKNDCRARSFIEPWGGELKSTSEWREGGAKQGVGQPRESLAKR